ncbi:MAG: TDP-N-acetylfucosamine:lipid II N-acetylfucosaminyltransferase [Bacteroidetes bacterium]|nr:TDP-N-acetylfucosamine:lipid II N-acetylfucosaminyltransferase [Bacteroidota bacterium]
MNIHIVDDQKFINQSFERFEKYYPNQNIFFVQVGRDFKGGFKYVQPNNHIVPLCLTKKGAIDKILKYCEDGECNLFIHYLRSVKAYIALEICKRINCKTHWIFYGADLYSILQKKGAYTLNDYGVKKTPIKKKLRLFFLQFLMGSTEGKPIETFIKKLDYFCFWNHFDYLLLKKHFPTEAKFKLFRYFAASINKLDSFSTNTNNNVILVNHSASVNGNHLTILSKLKKIDIGKRIKKVYVPLSYGSEKVINPTIEYGTANLAYAFVPIRDYMSASDYYGFLNKVGVAFFGHRRQEGGNNIFYLLSTGAKVFLRRENNLFHYLREKGYHVYDFDSDLLNFDDLELLSKEKQLHNRQLIEQEFSQEYIDSVYQNLIEPISTDLV